MSAFFKRSRFALCRKLICSVVAVSFFGSMTVPPSVAQVLPNLPAPGQMIWLTPIFEPPILKGMTVHAENPLLFDFIVDRGQDKISDSELKDEGMRLAKYFLAAMTIPNKEAWVNLSPYEKDRIIPDALGKTEMGRTMLEQDYILKQLSASLTNPEKELGQKFWAEVKARALKKFGTQQEVPLSTFNKVWIVPNGAKVFEKNGFVYITESKLKVMMEQDYVAMQRSRSPEPVEGEDYVALQRSAESRAESRDLAMQKTLEAGRSTLDKNPSSVQPPASSVQISQLSAEVFREQIIPQLENEVNTGKNFAQVRQVYSGVILATWYKQALKESLLGRVYADKSKVEGVETDMVDFKQKVYEQYLEAFQKGVYNVIKEEESFDGEDLIPRKYFSGGFTVSSATVQVDPSPQNRRAAFDGLRKGFDTGSSTIITVAGEEPASAPIVEQIAAVRAAQQEAAARTVAGSTVMKQGDAFERTGGFLADAPNAEKLAKSLQSFVSKSVNPNNVVTSRYGTVDAGKSKQNVGDGERGRLETWSGNDIARSGRRYVAIDVIINGKDPRVLFLDISNPSKPQYVFSTGFKIEEYAEGKPVLTMENLTSNSLAFGDTAIKFDPGTGLIEIENKSKQPKGYVEFADFPKQVLSSAQVQKIYLRILDSDVIKPGFPNIELHGVDVNVMKAIIQNANDWYGSDKAEAANFVKGAVEYFKTRYPGVKPDAAQAAASAVIRLPQGLRSSVIQFFAEKNGQDQEAALQEANAAVARATQNMTQEQLDTLSAEEQDKLYQKITGSDAERPVPAVASASTLPVGGIDFDPALLNLQIKRDGRGVPLPLPQQDLERIDIKGLHPVIINIQPLNMTTLPILSELNTEPTAALSKT